MPTTTDDAQTVGVKVKVGSGAVLMACAHISTAAAASKAVWFASPTTSNVKVAGTACNTVAWSHVTCMGADSTEMKYAASAGVADNTA